METLSQISLGATALLIFAVCAVYMLIRGLLRTITHLSILALSIWMGFLAWQKAPSLAIQWTSQTSPLITTGLPIVTFVLTFILIRKIFSFFLLPIPIRAETEDDDPPPTRSLTSKLFVTFIFASGLCLIAAAVLHHLTTLAEIRDYAKKGSVENDMPGFPARLKKSLTTTLPASVFDKLDPLGSQPRVELVKMIADRSENPSHGKMDPQPDKTAPYVLVINNPELIALAKKGRFSTLLHHPLLSEALKDPLVKKLLGID
jgi:hypothetical protein